MNANPQPSTPPPAPRDAAGDAAEQTGDAWLAIVEATLRLEQALFAIAAAWHVCPARRTPRLRDAANLIERAKAKLAKDKEPAHV